MHAQLKHLREMGKERSVSVRVVPSDSPAHPGMVGGFMLLEFPTARPVVHVELARTAVFLDEAPMTGSVPGCLRAPRRRGAECERISATDFGADA